MVRAGGNNRLLAHDACSRHFFLVTVGIVDLPVAGEQLDGFLTLIDNCDLIAKEEIVIFARGFLGVKRGLCNDANAAGNCLGHESSMKASRD